MGTMNCPECRAELVVRNELAGQQVRCAKCQTVVDVPAVEEAKVIPLAPVLHRESSMLVGFYLFLIIVGVGLVVYLYGVRFDDLSETQLVNFTPVWVFSLVFGIYGLIARHLVRLVQQGRAETLRDAVYLWTRTTGVVGLIPMLPFLFVAKWQHSLVTSFLGAFVWALLLAFFFSAIFPHL